MNKKGKKQKTKNSSNNLIGMYLVLKIEINSKNTNNSETDSKINQASFTPNKFGEKGESNAMSENIRDQDDIYERESSSYENEAGTDELLSNMGIRTGNDNPLRPTTRLKSGITPLSPSRNSQDSEEPYKVLKAFDDFYKNPKNIENELYYYRPPRVSCELFQISTKPSDILSSIPSSQKIKTRYDFEKISKEDYDYYMKFVNFYKEKCSKEAFMLKGGPMVEEMAFELLKSCSYDINVALAKILFPSLEHQSPGIFTDLSKRGNLMLKVNSALNDLIGSNNFEKKQWLDYVTDKIEKKIDSSELQNLLELASSMKIDIPMFVVNEISKSQSFSKLIRRHLNEKNNLKVIIDLLKQSETYKVKTEEFYLLNDIIKKTENWLARANEFENKEISYKNLQLLYNDGKCLPVKLDNFENVKKRYLKTQSWYERYNALPKHSKTRQQGAPGDRCLISTLSSLIQDSDEINFTSQEVTSLKINFDILKEYENRILMTLEDDLTPKTKENLTEFLNSLDVLKFTTDLYDLLMSKLFYFEWKEKKDYYMSNKVLKRKHLLNLIKDSNQKNLNGLSEIRYFKMQVEEIEKWLDTMSAIFYKENADPISLETLHNMYDQGNKFELQPEEVDHLFAKCIEVFDFVEECRLALNSQSFQYEKLSKLREQIIKYNIQCEEFDTIDSQIKSVHNWVLKSKKFLEKFSLRLKSEVLLKFEELVSIESRQKNIDMMENFTKKNVMFYENLMELIEQVPQFARSSEEYTELMKIKTLTEEDMNSDLYSLESLSQFKLEDLIAFILKISKNCIKRSLFNEIISIYKSRSWSYIVLIKKPKVLSEAELLLKEAANLSIQVDDINYIKEQVQITKEWIKSYKKLIQENLNYPTLKNLLNESYNLPLKPNEIEQLKSFNDELEININLARDLLKKKATENEIDNLVKKIYDINIEVPEFEVLKHLQKLVEEWGNISNKILSSRILCELYFSVKPPKQSPSSKLRSPSVNGLANLGSDEKKSGSILNYFQKQNNKEKSKASNEEKSIKSMRSLKSLKSLRSKSKSKSNKSIRSNNKSNKSKHFSDDDQVNSSIYHSEDGLDNNKMPNQKYDVNLHDFLGKKRMKTKFSNFSLKSMNKMNKITENAIKFSDSLKMKKKNNKFSFKLPKSLKSLNNVESNNNSNGNNTNTNNSIDKSYDKKSTKKDYENILNLINNNFNNQFDTPLSRSKIHNVGNKKYHKKGFRNSNNSDSKGSSKHFNHDKNNTNSLMHSHSQLSRNISTKTSSRNDHEDKVRLKKFNNFTYEERLHFLEKILVLKKENLDDIFCICRRGDDSVNYMIQCEGCKEWFHGKCLKILEYQSQKISQYLCLLCSCRKENFNNQFHNDFLNYRRISFSDFVNFIEEGNGLRVELKNLDILKKIKIKVEDWLSRSKNYIKSLISNLDKQEAKKLNVDFFEDSSEKYLMDLYNESESYPVENEMSSTIILMLKQCDWFKEATKCLESKKFSIKIAKKVLCNSSGIFCKEFIVNSNQSDVEQEYFIKISIRQSYLYDEILIIYEKFNNIMTKFNEYKLGLKSDFDDIEEIIHQVEYNNNCDELLELIQRYEDWKNIVKLAVNDAKNVSVEVFNEYRNQANTFPFKTTFLENFKKVSGGLNNQQKDYNPKLYLNLIKDEKNETGGIKRKKFDKELNIDFRDFRDLKDLKDMKDSKDLKEFKDLKDLKDIKEFNNDDSEKDSNSIIKIALEK